MHRRTTRRFVGTLCLSATMLLLSSCRTDWSTWGYGTERQGYNPAETTISPSNVGGLHQQWSVDLGAYINAAPIVATDISIDGTATDVVYIGNEHGALVALSTTGRVLWLRGFGTQTADCPDTPDKLFGVSAPPVFDRASNRLYVGGGDGNIYALDPATGATLPGWPVRITTDPSHEFQYAAPNLFNGGLYVGLSSRCDLPPYHGRLVRIDTETRAQSAFYVTGSADGPTGGGIWGWGGASIDPANGNVYVGTANVQANPENYLYGDAVVRLNPDLSVVAFNSPGVGREDDGVGSTPVLFQKSGCPAQLAFQMKNGGLYLYDRDNIANGSRQKVQLSTFSINVPAWSPATQMLYAVSGSGSGSYVKGIQAFRLNEDCNLSLAWQSASNVRLGSTPTIANGVVYYTDGANGVVHALDASTGASLWTSGPEITAGVLAAPVVANGRLFVAGYDGSIRAYGI